MKSIFLQTSVLTIIAALGVLPVAHAQSPASNGAANDAASNPLRGGRGDVVPARRANEVGPVDTEIPPGDNPLRRSAGESIRRPLPYDSAVRPVSGVEPVRQPATGQAAAPQRIRLIADGSVPADASYRSEPHAEPRAIANPEPPRPSFLPSTAESRPIGPRIEPVADNVPAYRPGSIRDAAPTPDRALSSAPASSGIFSSNAGNSASPSGSGQPGDKQLEGPQSPQVSVQKIAPPEVQVGRPAVFRLVVRNTGPVAASDVEVVDRVPRGTKLLGTSPKASTGPRGELVWSLGTLKPGAETAVEMQLMPTDEGEIGSVASVRFQAEATARSVVTRPKLVVTTAGSASVLVGDETLMTFTVSNPGSGIATGVVLEEHIPAALKHPGGNELEYTVGDLRPGESRQLQLKLKASQAGTINNVITARGDASLHAEHRFNLQIVSPQLDITMNGPKRRYLEREATYQLSVSNPGTAPAEQVELVAYLPQGLKFVNANNAGRYDASARAVYWRLDALPVNERGTVELVTLPVEAGQFNIKVHGAAQRGLSVDKEQPVLVEGLAAVLFQLAHTKDPIEVGGETTYEISVVNQGSKASTNLQIAVFLPPELKPLAAEGPARYTIESNKVVFENLPQLGPKTVANFRVRTQGVRAGDLRVRCQLKTDEMQIPVVKEESTRVFADE